MTATDSTSDPIFAPLVDTDRETILAAMLDHVAFDGWTLRAVRRALSDLGRDSADAPILFPDGAAEMIELWSAMTDRAMLTGATAADLAAYRTPGRVRAIITIRFELVRPHKEALRRALAILALPRHARLAAKLTARTVDQIWFAAGDRSADFAWYTKRALLAGVYSSTLLFWLRDISEDDQDTIAFLDRRLNNVAQIGKLRKRIEGFAPRLPRRLAGRVAAANPSPPA
jgi:ubiquinone biosynthesis protein COQ9